MTDTDTNTGVRILITGARIMTDKDKVRRALTQAAVFTDTGDAPDSITLISGACPTGADALCEQVANEFGWAIERHPANWNRYGKRAGYVRNQEMADAGADICLAFPVGESRGTRMMIRCAVKAGILTFTYEGGTTYNKEK